MMNKWDIQMEELRGRIKFTGGFTAEFGLKKYTFLAELLGE